MSNKLENGQKKPNKLESGHDWTQKLEKWQATSTQKKVNGHRLINSIESWVTHSPFDHHLSTVELNFFLHETVKTYLAWIQHGRARFFSVKHGWAHCFIQARSKHNTFVRDGEKFFGQLIFSQDLYQSCCCLGIVASTLMTVFCFLI